MAGKSTSKYAFEINRDSLTDELVEVIHQRLLKKLALQASQFSSTDEELEPFFFKKLFFKEYRSPVGFI